MSPYIKQEYKEKRDVTHLIPHLRLSYNGST
nr:MAG TPA: hypothetical protein [Caudoviricetes sp.]DAQ13758.1 MAG TPA: hypothetical protein [Caudoviricetes sp.]